jgi:AMMECR1 domain-containing protein
VDLRRGTAHSVFLPQVAAEHGWGVEQLLRQLALKAGLAEDGWRDAELRVFQGERFGEEP